MATVSIRGDGRLWLELASLSAQPLRCVRNGNNFWTPSKASLAGERMAEAPAPATTARMRLVQMRRLSEQFAARTEPMNEPPNELRMLTQPLYRYGDEAAEVIDGALFGFTETTDPEVLLVLEAVRPRGDVSDVAHGAGTARDDAPHGCGRADVRESCSALGGIAAL